MSRRGWPAGPKPPTVRERILELIEATPPPPGRKSRLDGRWGPHISKEDFARVVETGESQIKSWTHAESPSYPDAKNRERLAAVSRGRYTADDFRKEAEPSTADRLARLEDQAVTVEDLAPWLRIIRLLAEGQVGEARAALPDPEEAR